jgi:hypothetical protein
MGKSRKDHQMKTGVVRGNPDTPRPRKPSLDRAPGQVRPFTPGEKDYDPNPPTPKKFDGTS